MAVNNPKSSLRAASDAAVQRPASGMVVNDPKSSPMKNIKFLATMPEEEYKKYGGQWVAVASGEIVAHGKDPERVHQDGCRAGKGVPFMDYIYADYTEVPAAYYVPR